MSKMQDFGGRDLEAKRNLVPQGLWSQSFAAAEGL